MELSPRQLEHVLGPAIVHNTHIDRVLAADISWEASALNPKNRVDDLFDKAPNWVFMRENISLSRFTIVPTFAIGQPPRRISICLQDIDIDSPRWRPLQPNLVVLVQQAGTRRSDLSQHIMNALEHWSLSRDDFEAEYVSMPFGSSIRFVDLSLDYRRCMVEFVPNHDLELQWRSLRTLQKAWGLPMETWPPAIDVSELRLLEEPHDAISMVAIPRRHGSQAVVFKSAVQHVRYLYHELKQLLTLRPHPNIVRAPHYLVTKRVEFGGKFGLCGFILEYHAKGTLGNLLWACARLAIPIDMSQKFRWAHQLISALMHIVKSPVGYYSDLKLDNLVLKQSEHDPGYDLVLLDIEQRGSWYSWSPPEINFISHLADLATPHGRDGPMAAVQAKYSGFLRRHLPQWQEPGSNASSDEFGDGYNVAWNSLDPYERESAMVFMLGKMLWCIFESQPTINSVPSVGAQVFREVNPDHRFPEFRITPALVRTIIRRCASGAPEWAQACRPVECRGVRVFPAGRYAHDMEEHDVARQTLTALRVWWTTHQVAAEQYVLGSRGGDKAKRCDQSRLAAERPTLHLLAGLLRDAAQDVLGD